MKLTAIFAILICQLASAQTNFFSLLCCSNRTYTNATIESVTPVSALIEWGSSGERIPITNLPPDLQIRYHYDPAKAARFLDEVKQRKKALATAQEAAQKAAAKRTIVSEADDKLKITFEDIRDTVTWEPKPWEEANVSLEGPSLVYDSDSFRVGFFAVLDKGDVQFTTNDARQSGKPLRMPSSVTMTLLSHSHDWRFLQSHDLIIVYDGNRKEFGELKHHGDVLNDGVLESFYPDFTYAEFRDLSLARSVKAVLGTEHFELSYENRAAMRAFVNYFDYSLTSATNGTAATSETRP